MGSSTKDRKSTKRRSRSPSKHREKRHRRVESRGKVTKRRRDHSSPPKGGKKRDDFSSVRHKHQTRDKSRSAERHPRDAPSKKRRDSRHEERYPRGAPTTKRRSREHERSHTKHRRHESRSVSPRDPPSRHGSSSSHSPRRAYSSDSTSYSSLSTRSRSYSYDSSRSSISSRSDESMRDDENTEKNPANKWSALLGENSVSEKKGPKIDEDLEKLLTSVCREGLDPKIKEELINDFPYPENCVALKAPALNPEIRSALSIKKSILAKDNFQVILQNQIGTGLSGISQGMTTIFELAEKEKLSDNIKRAFLIIADGVKLIADSHHELSKTRKFLINPHISKLSAEVAKQMQIDDNLYGENYSEKLKKAKEIQKDANDTIKAAFNFKKALSTNTYSDNASTSRNLNSRGPLDQRRTSNFRQPRGQKKRHVSRRGHQGPYKRRYP